MRYKAIANNFTLTSVDGTIRYRFKKRVLDLGDGNEIQPNLTGADNVKLIVVNPDGTSDLEKVGLGLYFWESPKITATGGTFTLDADTYYDVDMGIVEYEGKRYYTGQRFKTGTATSADEIMTGTVVSKSIPPEYYKENEVSTRSEMHKYHWLVDGETDWDDARMQPYATDPRDTL